MGIFCFCRQGATFFVLFNNILLQKKETIVEPWLSGHFTRNSVVCVFGQSGSKVDGMLKACACACSCTVYTQLLR